MELETNVDSLPLPRPSMIELEGDDFIRNPRLKDKVTDFSGIDQMLAKTPEERLQWNEAWKQFVRQCLRKGWTAAMIASSIWGDGRVDEAS